MQNWYMSLSYNNENIHLCSTGFEEARNSQIKIHRKIYAETNNNSPDARAKIITIDFLSKLIHTMPVYG